MREHAKPQKGAHPAASSSTTLCTWMNSHVYYMLHTLDYQFSETWHVRPQYVHVSMSVWEYTQSLCTWKFPVNISSVTRAGVYVWYTCAPHTCAPHVDPTPDAPHRLCVSKHLFGGAYVLVCVSVYIHKRVHFVTHCANAWPCATLVAMLGMCCGWIRFAIALFPAGITENECVCVCCLFMCVRVCVD